MKIPVNCAVAALGLVAAAEAGLNATTFIKVGNYGTIRGTVNAGTTLEIATNANISDAVSACGQATVADQSRFKGIYSQSILPATSTWTSRDIVSSPAWTANQVCAVKPLPTATFSPGTTAYTLEVRQNASLPAAARGAVTVKDGAKLTLGAGVHQFSSLTVGPDAKLLFEQGALLKVSGNVSLGDRVTLAGPGAKSADFIIGGNLQVLTRANFPMSVTAAGDITIGDYASLKDVAGRSITLGTNTVVDGTPDVVIPTSTLVFSDDFNASADYYGNSYNHPGFAAAMPKWDLLQGAIDLWGYESYLPISDLIPPEQGRVVDLEGTIDPAVYPSSQPRQGKITTKTIFPAGKYQVNFKMSGSLRRASQLPVQSATFRAQATFGTNVHEETLDWDAPFRTISYNVTLAEPSKFTVEGLPSPDASKMFANLMLDDVAIYKLE